MPHDQGFWDREVECPTHHNWLDDPQVRLYANGLIGDGQALWPLDWFQRVCPRRFALGLSAGCGTGPLERDVIRRGICDRIEAFDASEVSLAAARDAATAEGLHERIEYRNEDFEVVRLPARRYDIVFFHQSLHHVSRLERLLRQVVRSLKPGGLLYLDEFVGPSRTYWNARTVAWYRALYKFIPPECRYTDEMLMPVQWDDWTEAVRSGEILSRVRVGFHIRALRGYGGNVLAVLFPAMIPGTFESAIVQTLIEAEKAILTAGVPPFYSLVIAEPKRGMAGAFATLRYLVDPKLRRITREFRARFGSGRLVAPEEDIFRV
jgi:SAM-dependent methyltransferase